MKKTLFTSALVICALTAVTLDAACSRGSCSRKRTVARYAVARNTRGIRKSAQPRPAAQAVRRGGCANGSCSL